MHIEWCSVLQHGRCVLSFHLQPTFWAVYTKLDMLLNNLSWIIYFMSANNYCCCLLSNVETAAHACLLRDLLHLHNHFYSNKITVNYKNLILLIDRSTYGKASNHKIPFLNIFLNIYNHLKCYNFLFAIQQLSIGSSKYPIATVEHYGKWTRKKSRGRKKPCFGVVLFFDSLHSLTPFLLSSTYIFTTFSFII